MMYSPSKVVILFYFLILTKYCGDAQTVPGGNTILHLLEGNGTNSSFDGDGTDFDIFSYLFSVSSHSHRLEEDIPGDITVIAPDDNAFRNAVSDLGLPSRTEQETYENFLIYLMKQYRYPFDFLTRILYYHIIPGEYNSTAALQLPSFVTWDAQSRITLDGTTLIDRNPEQRNPHFDTERMDIKASNGIVHVVDYVLFPEVMRKLDSEAACSECSSPEPTFEDAEVDGQIDLVPNDSAMEAAPTRESEIVTSGSGPQDGALDTTPMEDAVLSTTEPENTSEDVPVTTGPRLEPTEDVFANSTPQQSSVPSAVVPQVIVFPEDVVSPSQEVAAGSMQGSKEPATALSSSALQASPDHEVLTLPSLQAEAPESQLTLQEEGTVSTTMIDPTPLYDPSKQVEGELEAKASPDVAMEQVTHSDSPRDPMASSEFGQDDDNTPQFSFTGTADVSETPAETDAEPAKSIDPEPSFVLRVEMAGSQ